MNTVDTALRDKVLEMGGEYVLVPNTPEMDLHGNVTESDTCYITLDEESLEALISSLTNEAELRGRQSELEELLEAKTYPIRRANMEFDAIPYKTVADRLAALLKLKGGEEKK